MNRSRAAAGAPHAVQSAEDGRNGAWFGDLLACDVVDLASTDPRLEGIFAPEGEKNAERIGITDQFLENAEKYSATYSSTPHFLRLFDEAFKTIGYSPQPDAAILDIGSGSGANSVVPCLELFPNCRIVASDLSLDLLRLLRGYLKNHRVEDRVACFCADALHATSYETPSLSTYAQQSALAARVASDVR